MNKQNELTDEEFVPFLHSLGVETLRKSFDWMLSGSTFSGVFTWLYNNLDHNNTLTAREEYIYLELQKSNCLLSEEDLEEAISSIQHEYPGICLPGDQEGLEDVIFNISMQKDKLHALEKEEKVLRELIAQNKQIHEHLSIGVTDLNGALQQCSDDEEAAAVECLTLAQEGETLTDMVVDVIAKGLDMYESCHVNKGIAKNFIYFGPIDAYRQSQALFRSHFDLYTTRKLRKGWKDSFTDEDLRNSIAEARNLEERLSHALVDYIESKALLCGEQALLELLSNYRSPHPTQFASLIAEASSGVELSLQAAGILAESVRGAARALATQRTQRARRAAVATAGQHRRKIHSDLCHLVSVCSRALRVDRTLHGALRRELRALHDALLFATQLRDHVLSERAGIATRIEAMSSIIAAHSAATADPRPDFLVLTLSAMLGCARDAGSVLDKCGELRGRGRGRGRGEGGAGSERREEQMELFKTALLPLKAAVYNGATRQPGGTPPAGVLLADTLARRHHALDHALHQLGGQFTAVKNGDKRNQRKLWQWFLADPQRFLAAVGVDSPTQ